MLNNIKLYKIFLINDARPKPQIELDDPESRKSGVQALSSKLVRRIDETKGKESGERALASDLAVFERLCIEAPIRSKLFFKTEKKVIRNLVCSLPGFRECIYRETR